MTKNAGIKSLFGLALVAVCQGADQIWAETYGDRIALCSRLAGSPRLSDGDIEQIASILPNSLSKGEFETTEAYRKKVAATKEQIGEALRTRLGAPYIVVNAKPPFDFFEYNADQQKARLKFEKGYADIKTIGYKPEYAIATIKSTFDVVGEYEATNAFGAKATITRYSSIVRGVSVAEDLYPRTWPTNGKSEFLTLSPDKAKSLKENAAILIIASPKAPFVLREKRSGSPTFTHRMDVSTDTIALVGEPLCVGLVDKSSNTVLLGMLPRAPTTQKNSNRRPQKN